ncbi:hypothetical protein B0H12DRAFT_1101142 [Mycena haematopus]|nr:hypothetical protein B0H12DRAFT_1101142 [Mycena haematopus]
MFLTSSLASASTIGPLHMSYLWDSTLLHQFVLNLGSACWVIRVHTSVTAQYAGFYHRPYGGATTEVCTKIPPFPYFSAFIYSRSQTEQCTTSAMSGP